MLCVIYIIFIVIFLNIAASSLVVQRQLSRVIKRFKFGELESAVMPVFPEISWSRLRSKLIKNHKKFSVTNALRVIEEVINVCV